MHGLPRMAPQSIWLNGAPNWPPCEMWSSSRLPAVVGNSVVLTAMQLLSTTSKFNSPPPVTRQVTGCSQVTEALHSLGAVWIARPLASSTHGTFVLATAVPTTVTRKFVPPGQVTSTLQTV